MDPLTALSAAAAIAQFVDYGISVVSKTAKLYTSSTGALVENAELQEASERLVELSRSLKASTSEQGNKAIQNICDSCMALSDDLISKLTKLRLMDSQKGRKWHSFRQALKSVYSKTEINEISHRLESFRTELTMHILLTLRDQYKTSAAGQDTQFESIHATFQSLVKAQEAEHSITRDLQREVSSKLLDLQSSHTKEHDAIRAMLDEKKVNRIRTQLQLSILDSLRSNTMHERHDAIVDAHQRTFQWILSSTKEGGQHSFSEWLKMGSGLYWIQGKAGSGKSTLMKFVVDDPRTSEYLRQWAAGSAFEFCAFYFWRYGAPEQRSQHGLLQSILYSILRQRPDLIEIACTETWNYKYTMCTNDIPLKSDNPWMLGDLKKAFKRVMEQASSNTKFCIFIDGLDEYDGDYAEIASYFSQLSSSPFIKICVSGRPLPAFGYAFRDMPTLKLQNLTAEDIRQFVVAKFTSNDRAWSFLKTESSDANRLIDKIVHKADGVFLWVNLAVNSLLRGLDNNDDISVLERRLGDLPQELERLYSHMLASIESIYMEEASMAFQIYEACWYCRSAAIINQAWEEARSSPSGKTATKDTAKTLFQTRCGGLIDVEVVHTDVHLWRYRPTASYIHETVGTYISSPTIWQNLLSYTSQLDFDPNIALIKGATVRLTWACNSEPRNALEWIVFYWNVVSAAAIDIDENSSIANAASDALNEFDYVAHSLAKGWRTRAFAPH